MIEDKQQSGQWDKLNKKVLKKNKLFALIVVIFCFLILYFLGKQGHLSRNCYF